MPAKDPSSTPMPEPGAGPAPTVDGAAAPIVERKFVGLVEVDSGTMVVGDPLHLLARPDGTTPGVDFQAVIDAESDEVQPFASGSSLLLSLAMGDGTYPVFGEWEDGEFMSITVYLTPTEITLADELEVGTE